MDRNTIFTDHSRRDQSNRFLDRRNSRLDRSQQRLGRESHNLGESSQTATTRIIGFGQIPRSKVEIPS
jgi:hypothetical protein